MVEQFLLIMKNVLAAEAAMRYIRTLYFHWIKITKWVNVRYPDHCCSCEHCVSVCSENAVTHEELSGDAFQDLSGEIEETDELHNLMMARRSIRQYKDKPVPEELIQQLIKCGIHAGTGGNVHTENFIVIRERDSEQSPSERNRACTLISIREI